MIEQPERRIFAGRMVAEIAAFRATIAETRELLRTSPPDTFLGHQTHDPFPAEDVVAADYPDALSSGKTPASRARNLR